MQLIAHEAEEAVTRVFLEQNQECFLGPFTQLQLGNVLF